MGGCAELQNAAGFDAESKTEAHASTTFSAGYGGQFGVSKTKDAVGNTYFFMDDVLCMFSVRCVGKKKGKEAAWGARPNN